MKKPDDLDEKISDFQGCGGDNDDEIKVPLRIGGHLRLKQDPNPSTTPTTTTVDPDPIDTPTSPAPADPGPPRRYSSMVELPFGSGTYVNYAKPVNSIQSGIFLADDPPPYFSISAKMPHGAPKLDTEIEVDGEIKLIPGYVGKSKDAGTYLLERGELDLTVKTVHKLTKDNVEKYRQCQCQTRMIKPCCRSRERVYLLSQQPDFLAQRSCLEELFFSRGHLVLFGVKCHPEIAGLGVEYIWGTSMC